MKIIGKKLNLMKQFEGTTHLDASDFVDDLDETAIAGNSNASSKDY